MSIADLQRRYAELGRIRIGEKNEKGHPVRLETFRLTSPDEELLKHASGRWGGIPTVWAGAPTEGAQWELVTESAELEVFVPQQRVSDRQYYELYSKGGVQRRCDGVTELISGRNCRCDPDKRDCKPTSHILFMLPQLPGVGVWRLTSHGWSVATEMPTTVALLSKLAGEGVMPAATLAIETRTSIAGGQTHHFNVPVLKVPYALAELEAGGVPVLAGGPAGKPPIVSDSPELPADASFGAEPPWGERPALSEGSEAVGLDDESTDTAEEPGEESREGSEPGSDAEWDEALGLLTSVANGSLARAAAYVNKGSKTRYTAKNLKDATLEELSAGIDAAEELLSKGGTDG